MGNLCGSRPHVPSDELVADKLPLGQDSDSHIDSYSSHEDGKQTPASDLLDVSLHLRTVAGPPDTELQGILRLVASVVSCPNVLIALYGEGEQVSPYNAIGAFLRRGLLWRRAFAAFTLAMEEEEETMVVPDAEQDSRFQHNSLVVGPPGLRFVCGTPLFFSNGDRLGTLCFADTKPRDLDDSLYAILDNLADMAVRHIERQTALQVLQEGYDRMLRTVESGSACAAVSGRGLTILHANQTWMELTGVPRESVMGLPLSEVFGVVGEDQSIMSLVEAAEAGRSFELRAGVLCSSNGRRSGRRFTLTFKPAAREALGMLRSLSGMASVRPGSGAFNSPRRGSGSRASATGSGTFSALSRLGSAGGSFGLCRAGAPPVIPSAGAAAGSEAPSTCDGSPTSRCSSSGALGVPETYMLLEVLLEAPGPRSQLFGGRAGSGSCAARSGDRRRNSGLAKWSNQQSACDTSAAALSQIRNGIGGTGASSILGLAMGQLLGKGGFGCVYRGSWYGVPVAVKVLDQDLTAVTGVSKEAMMGQELRHPFIVATLQYIVRRIPRACGGMDQGQSQHSSDGSESSAYDGTFSGGTMASLNSCPSGQVPGAFMCGEGAVECQTMIVMEYCDKGSIQDAVERGWLRMPDEPPPVADGPATDSPSADVSAAAAAAAAAVPAPTPPPPAACASAADIAAAAAAEGVPLVILSPFAMAAAAACPQAPIGLPNMDAIVATACEVAGAVRFLHNHDIVHGDLSGWNVMLCTSSAAADNGGRRWVAKIADFGLSRCMNLINKVHTRTYGTLTHMPPETLTEGTVSKGTDVYSMGVLMWQMYTGRKPWSGMTPAQIVVHVGSGELSLQFPPGTPNRFGSLATRCLARDPGERPTMDAMCAELGAMRTELGGHELWTPLGSDTL